MENTEQQQVQTMKKLPSFSDLFNGAKQLVMKRKELFFTLAALPSLIQLVGVIILATMPALAPLTFLLMLVSIVLTFFVTIAMVKAVANETMTDWKKAFNESKSLFWPYFLASILVGIVILIGFVLFIIPGIYLSIALGFYYFTLILENKRGWDSAQASKDLVKGYWWAVFGRILLFAIVIAVIAGILGGIVEILDSEILSGVLSALINIVVTPFGVAFSYLIYKSLKSAKGSSMSAPQS